MEQLVHLSVIPIVMLLLSLVLSRTDLTRKLVPIGLWAQLALSGFLLYPLLSGAAIPTKYCEGLVLDRLGALFVVLTIFVVACAATQADSYFGAEQARGENTFTFRFRVFYACINIFLLTMMAVFFCDNSAFLWMAIEASTLAAAPLVYYDRTKNAIEATWKFLIICSVGIAFALLGTVLIFASTQRGAFPEGCLNFSEMLTHARVLEFPLLRLGFFFCLIGYGTKAGIFPMHSWLPDAYSEAPAPVSAVLSGALCNCALFGIWRVLQVVLAARPGHAASQIVVVLGTVTVVAASLFLIRQYSLKRMWAYSSIENVGLMVVAIGLGSGMLFFLQALNHSLAKVALFLLSGSITQAGGSKRLNKLSGVLRACPVWGGLLMLATLGVTGAPPFGAFVSEMAILVKCAEPTHWVIAPFLIAAIAISFVAVCAHVGRVLLGAPKPDFKPFQPLRASLVPAILVLSSLALGLFVEGRYILAPEETGGAMPGSVDHSVSEVGEAKQRQLNSALITGRRL